MSSRRQKQYELVEQNCGLFIVILEPHKLLVNNQSTMKYIKLQWHEKFLIYD